MEALTYTKAGSSNYILNEKATLEKLQAAATKQAIEVTRNIGSTVIHFSTGAYVSVVIPLVMTWQDIKGHHIDDKLVDGMDIIVDKIIIKKDKAGTIEHYRIKLAVDGQKVTVTVGQLGGLICDPREQVDAHGLVGDTGVGVHLLQDLVDVDGVEILPLALPLLLVALGNLLGGLARLGGGLSGGLGRHVDGLVCTVELMAVPLVRLPLCIWNSTAGDAIGTA